jgi:hypothetical protein
MIPVSPTKARASSGDDFPVLVSGESPLPPPDAEEPYWWGSDAGFQDWEQDNSLAVEFSNRDSLIAAWQQDFTTR